MLKKSAFFDFLNRRDSSFEKLFADTVEDEDYIDWNDFLLADDYGDAEFEYHSIRSACALFDVSPMRKIRVRGSGAGQFFDQLLTRPVSILPTMQASYTILCNEDGSIKDDAILYKFADDDFLFMPSDIDHSPYFRSFCQGLDIHSVTFTECTEAWVGLAIQGPQSAAVLLSMGFDGIEQLKPFEIRDYDIGFGKLQIARMGFTADLGYECWLAPDQAAGLRQGIELARSEMNIPIPGYGLSALQACRLEAGFIVVGWDCSSEVDPQPGFERSPYELGLGWLVDLDSTSFVGRKALQLQKQNGFPYTLRSLQIDDRRLPDDGARLLVANSRDAAVVGSVNCSSWSWGMQRVIGNASVLSEFSSLSHAWVEIDGNFLDVELSHGPLVTIKHRNLLPAPLN